MGLGLRLKAAGGRFSIPSQCPEHSSLELTEDIADDHAHSQMKLCLALAQRIDKAGELT